MPRTQIVKSPCNGARTRSRFAWGAILPGLLGFVCMGPVAASAPQPTDLSISKTDSPDPVVADNNLIYTVRVDNAGPFVAQNVVVTDTLPAGVTFVSTSGCAEDPGGVPTCGQSADRDHSVRTS